MADKKKFSLFNSSYKSEDSDMEKLKDSFFIPKTHQPRASHSLQTVIQLSAGVLVLFVVLVCVSTLVINHPSSKEKRQLLHRPVHTDPNFSQSILYHKLRKEMTDSVINPVLLSPGTSLEDIFISVKTSQKFHRTRLPPVLGTWFQMAKSSTYFFTDNIDEETEELVGSDHLIDTKCPSDHSRQALCCKMQTELEVFIQSEKSWFCHFDDDQYVNVGGLEEKLRQFDSSEDWYLGRPSVERPLQILDREDRQAKAKISFLFATGGAGFCLSKSLTVRLEKLLKKELGFANLGEKMRLPDDVTMGYLVEWLAGVKMTKIDEFHSHLEPLRLIQDLEHQISFSYSTYASERNIVDVPSPTFSEADDPTRFLSIHCHLNPYIPWCREGHAVPSVGR